MSRIVLFLLLAVSLNSFSQKNKSVVTKAKYTQLAYEAYNTKAYNAAFNYFEMAVGFSNNLKQDSLIVFNCAVAADKANLYEKAIKFYRKSISIGYNAQNSLLFIAKIEKRRGNNTQYIQVLKEGAANYKTDLFILSLVNYYLETGDIDNALINIDKAILINSNNASLYFAKGSIYEQRGKSDLAKFYYEEAINANPKYFDAYFNLGALYFNVGIKMVTEANNIPGNEQKKYDVAIEVANNEFVKAIPYLEAAYSIDPSDKTTPEALKNAYYRLFKRNKAYELCFKEIEKRLKGEPNNYLDYEAQKQALEVQNIAVAEPAKKQIYNKSIAEKPQTIKTDKKQIEKPQPTKPKIPQQADLDIIDKNIPVSSGSKENTFAVVIGNENYQNEQPVPYAINDALAISKYLNKTVGLPKENIHTVTNATLGQIYTQLKWIQDIQMAYGGDASIIFYYAGHGMPSESSKDAYLLPVDGISEMPMTGIKLALLNNEITRNSSKQVLLILDACFSGASREGMLAKGRGVKIVPKNAELRNNLIVFSATQNDQTAYPYKDKKHGLFTYYLLKKLNETKGNVTIGELSEYVKVNVSRKAIVVNSKPQTPTVKTSPNLMQTWEQKQIAY